MQPPSSDTEARSKRMLTQRYRVHCVPKAFDTMVFVSLMDFVEGPLHSATSSVADLSPSLNSRLFEGGWLEKLLAGLSPPEYGGRYQNSLNSGLGLSLPSPVLGHSAHRWLNEWSIGHFHICFFTDMSFDIHGPKLSVRSIIMHLFRRTSTACSKIAFSMMAGLLSP